MAIELGRRGGEGGFVVGLGEAQEQPRCPPELEDADPGPDGERSSENVDDAGEGHDQPDRQQHHAVPAEEGD